MAEEHQEATEGQRDGAKAQPSEPNGDSPGTAGSGETAVRSGPGEKAAGRLNPSSPGNTGTTPGSVAKEG